MTSASSPLLGRPLWYELMTTDTKPAERFYQTVVGWTSTPFEGSPQPYTLFKRNGDSVAGLMKRPDEMHAPPFWAMYVGVPKLEDAASHITRLGGRACSPVIEVPTVGRLQMMMDPQGAAFYIFEPSDPAGQRPEGQPEIGDASWHELMTTDAPAAMTFYRDVFGWQPSEAMDMGPMGKYQMFNRPHGMIGGMMNKPPEMANVPPNWQIYFRVPDVDAAAERIKANGGRILNGPMDVPGGSRVLNAADPQGAVFGLHSRAQAAESR